jgi:hypothetical protein
MGAVSHDAKPNDRKGVDYPMRAETAAAPFRSGLGLPTKAPAIKRNLILQKLTGRDAGTAKVGPASCKVLEVTHFGGTTIQ